MRRDAERRASFWEGVAVASEIVGPEHRFASYPAYTHPVNEAALASLQDAVQYRNERRQELNHLSVQNDLLRLKNQELRLQHVPVQIKLFAALVSVVAACKSARRTLSDCYDWTIKREVLGNDG